MQASDRMYEPNAGMYQSNVNLRRHQYNSQFLLFLDPFQRDLDRLKSPFQLENGRTGSKASVTGRLLTEIGTVWLAPESPAW